jgi:hypothetical protein
MANEQMQIGQGRNRVPLEASSAKPENTVIPKHVRKLSHAPNRLSMPEKYELSLSGYGTRDWIEAI